MPRLPFLCVLLSILAIGCADPKTTTVTLRTANLEGTDVEIWDMRKRVGAFQETPLAGKGTIDSTGVFTAAFDVGTPGLYYVTLFPRGAAQVFLHPGQALDIMVDGDDWRGTLAYDGDFAGEQVAYGRIQTLAWARGLDTLDAETFVKAAGHLEERLRAGTAAVLDSVDASPEFRRHMWAYVDARLFFTRENYLYMQERTGRYPELPAGLFDPEVIIARHADLMGEVTELRSIAERAYMDSIRKAILADPPLDADVRWQTEYKIERINAGPDDFRRPFLYASALVQYVALEGITPHVDSLIAEYGPRLRPQDRAVLDEVYANYAAMLDNPAPDFEFFLPDSTRMMLSDLKGKAVYIDVWATWCGPCLVQMPFSKALRERYAEREDLVFLYVSVDDNIEAWHRMVAEREDLLGAFHGATMKGWEGPLKTDYRITGIPRTILVGKDGRLVRVSAPAPSSREIVPLLDEVIGPAATE